jgi:hypothetical protein
VNGAGVRADRRAGREHAAVRHPRDRDPVAVADRDLGLGRRAEPRIDAHRALPDAPEQARDEDVRDAAVAAQVRHRTVPSRARSTLPMPTTSAVRAVDRLGGVP